jgi:hypothetical protein
MRNRELHDALRDFALESAAQLTADLEAGAELSYDVLEEPGRGSVLYRYLPLTSEFIAERWDVLRTRPSCEGAAAALGEGAQVYLSIRGQPAAPDAEPALRALLERLYEDATDFKFPEERFERVYGEVERTLYAHTIRTVIVAPVHGLILESDRVDLGGGLLLARGDRISAPADVVWPVGPGERDRVHGPNAVCALERDVENDGQLPVSEARVRFRKLVSALRLWAPGRVAIGPLAYGRADESVWQPIPLAPCGPGRGEPLVITAEQEAELRQLCAITAGARLSGRMGWALARFEMGCEREADTEALSDHLLALEALLGADDDTGRGSMGLRVAALYAEEHDRRRVRRRLDAAFALQRTLMSGAPPDPDFDSEEAELPHLVVGEMEGYVRALLRDLICGYLAPDLRAVADDILLAGSDPIDIRARDTRAEVASDEPEAVDDPDELEPEPEPEPVSSRPPDGPGTAADPRSAAWAVAGLPGPRTQREPPPPPQAPEARPDQEPTLPDPAELDTGVTPSTDWELDEDPASYSAPI